MYMVLARARAFLIGLIVSASTCTTSAHAQSWAESWFDNVTYTSPGSFEDQTRGYVTAGGMSALQKFASVHAYLHNHFSPGSHLVDRKTCKERRSAALAEWHFLAR